jgi:transcription termination factor Rho
MDDLIYEEFKGTGNSEMHLNRKLSERRIFPAIDVERSSTRREDLLLDDETLARVFTLRRMIDMMGGGAEAVDPLIARLSKTRSNKEFLMTLNKEAF